MIERQKKDIPPGLLRIVKGSKPSKKFFLLLGLSLFLVISGFGAVYFYNQYFSKEIKNQHHHKQAVIQNISQLPVQSHKTEPVEESNNTEKLTTSKIQETKIHEKIIPSENHQKQHETIKITKNKKTENKIAQKEIPLAPIDTFKGADYLYRAQDYEQKGMLNEAINEYKEYVNYSGC